MQSTPAASLTASHIGAHFVFSDTGHSAEATSCTEKLGHHISPINRPEFNQMLTGRSSLRLVVTISKSLFLYTLTLQPECGSREQSAGIGSHSRVGGSHQTRSWARHQVPAEESLFLPLSFTMDCFLRNRHRTTDLLNLGTPLGLICWSVLGLCSCVFGWSSFSSWLPLGVAQSS